MLIPFNIWMFFLQIILLDFSLTTMSPGSCSTPYGVRTVATLLIRRYRASSRTAASTPAYQHTRGDMRLSKFGYGIGCSTHHALCISSWGSIKRPEYKMFISSPFGFFFGFNYTVRWTLKNLFSFMVIGKHRKHETNLKVQPSDPDHQGANNFSWVKWVLGSMLPLMFSFWKQKWDSLLKLEGKVEEVVKEAEEAAEVVEKVASTTEKLSAEVAEKLENGKLKEVALTVEHVSNVIAKDARMTEDFIRKVGDLKQDLTDLEAMVEHVVDKTEHKK